ncbi:MAG TPA: sulfotransferase [Allosphingosinicella sp.]
MALSRDDSPKSARDRIAALRPLLEEEPQTVLAEAAAILRSERDNIDALLISAAALRRLGQPSRGFQAEHEALRASLRQPPVAEAARALNEGRLHAAERLLRPYLDEQPDDPAALRMMAAVARMSDRQEDAVPLLQRALDLAPDYAPARQELADAFAKLSRRDEALKEAGKLLAAQPDHPPYLDLKANILNGMGRYEEAAAIYERLIARLPDAPMLWHSYGHILRTLGRLDESVSAYRRVIALAPDTAGAAWWSLASLQTFRFSDDDIAAMTAAVAQEGASEDERLRIHFSLGKAFEDRKDWARSFDHYVEGNRLRRAQLRYDAEEASFAVRRSIALFTPEFFESRKGQGCAAPDPIFVIGLQRSGSTLVEQILSSHSRIEGTAELPDVPAFALRLGAKPFGEAGPTYPESLAALDAAKLKALGEEYIERTRVHRGTDRPFFIDKLPNNWAHIGFIHSILPNAKIIDVRRHPLDCCFSNYKQLYAMEQRFTYDLAELGRYYRDYVEMLRHFDQVRPGLVHRVIYEQLVEDIEGEVRRLLDYLGLPFEPSCLRFYENERAVRTASSEQVRRPINRSGIGRWKPYEPWLDPLKEALGPVLTLFPEVPPLGETEPASAGLAGT